MTKQVVGVNVIVGGAIMDNYFRLPESSYEEIVKLIKAYAMEKEGEAISLEKIANKTGMDKTTVSRNNAFLVSMGIVLDGKRKAVTEQGKKLGNAYTFGIMDEVDRVWKELISGNKFAQSMYEFIQIKGRVSRSDFVSHILYSAEGKDSSKARAGANAFVEIMCETKLINEEDGYLSVYQIEDKKMQISSEIFQEESQVLLSKQVLAEPNTDSCKQFGNVIVNLNVSVEDIVDHKDQIIDFLHEIKNIL